MASGCRQATSQPSTSIAEPKTAAVALVVVIL
jgi:hypothetical protein